jgi:hypothetical protein
MRARPALAVCLSLCAFVPSCSSSGSKLLKVTGTLKDNGRPFKADTLMVQIVFVPVVDAGKAHDSYPAVFKRADSSFEVAGKTGQGIEPGKYRVSVKYGTNSLQTVLEVTSSKEPLVLDVAKMESQ